MVKFRTVHAQTIARYSSLIATVNWTVQLDKQEFKLSANIRYVCSCYLQPHANRISLLAQPSRGGPTDPVEVLNKNAAFVLTLV